jgi:predicted esterase
MSTGSRFGHQMFKGCFSFILQEIYPFCPRVFSRVRSCYRFGCVNSGLRAQAGQRQRGASRYRVGFFNIVKKIIVVFVVFAVGAVLWARFRSLPPAPILPQSEIQAVANEILTIGGLYRGPEVTSDLSELIYCRSMPGGRGITKVNLKTGEESLFDHPYEISRVFGYSPDGRYLVFRDIYKKVERVLLLDRSNNKLTPITENYRLPTEVAWMTTNSFACIYRNEKGGGGAISRITISNDTQVAQRQITQRAVSSITPLSDRWVAYIDEGNFWRHDFDSGETEQLSKMSQAVLSSLRNPTQPPKNDFLYLNASRDNGQFLFCSSLESNWRSLFRFDPSVKPSGKLEQLSVGDEHCYSGKWIERGRGYAFVGNLTNHFYLAVRPADPAGKTNLFQGGHVFGFTVSDDGEKVFATASKGIEPPGVYEYDIPTRSLRLVSGQTNLLSTTATLLPRTERWVKSFDGLQVPYFVTEPKNFDKKLKYPLVLTTPPEGMQYFNSWEPFAQFFANIGAFHVAINPRGCDGYGKHYATRDLSIAYKDAYAVYKRLRWNRNIDFSRVYLIGGSSGSITMNLLVEKYPGRWAGNILISGGPPPRNLPVEQQPRYLLYTGRKDRREILDIAAEFVSWSQTNGVWATALSGPTGHSITDTETHRRLGYVIGDFIYERDIEIPVEKKPDNEEPAATKRDLTEG